MSTLVPELEKRRARRALSDKPLPSDVIDRILQAATLAPSCFNNQPWRYVVVTDPKKLEVVKQYLSPNNRWATASPAIILVATKIDLDCKLEGGRDYALFDTGMSAMALQAQAVREGLYVHPIAGYKALELRKAMGIPEEYVLITLIVLGYPGPDTLLNEKQKELEQSPRDRKPLKDVVSYDSWQFPG